MGGNRDFMIFVRGSQQYGIAGLQEILNDPIVIEIVSSDYENIIRCCLVRGGNKIMYSGLCQNPFKPFPGGQTPEFYRTFLENKDAG